MGIELFEILDVKETDVDIAQLQYFYVCDIHGAVIENVMG